MAEQRTFTWDPDTGYIKDQDGEPWGSADGPDHKDITREELEAFGRAMAAGPELMASLKEVLFVARLFNRRSDATWRAIEDKAISALRKAGDLETSR